MRTIETGNYLIEVTKPVAFLPEDKRIQVATLIFNKRQFHVNRGSAGYVLVHIRNVNILACEVAYLDE